jgi:hypothetical protein
MPSALQRAREEALKGSGKYEGEFLDNDTLIANQLVFQITDVVDDRGGGFNGQDCWRLRVEPFEDGAEDPDGIVTLTDNPARRKFMGVLDKELDDLLQKGADPVIGPCVMVRLKGKNYRFNEIVDWNPSEQRPILPPGAVLAGQRVEEDMRPTRPRRLRDVQEEEAQPQEQQRPFSAAVEAEAAASPAQPPFPTAPAMTGNASAPSAGRPESPESALSSVSPKTRRRAATTEPSTPSTSSPPAETAPTDDFPSLVEWARDNKGYRRGRVSKDTIEEYERAKRASEGVGEYAAPDPQLRLSNDSSAAPTSSPSPSEGRVVAYQGSVEDVERELAIVAARNAVPQPADVPVGAPNRDMIPGYDDGARAQEIKFRAGMTGTSIEACPSCGKKIHDRIFPTDQNSYALVHARCEAGGEQKMMEALPDV